MIPLVALLSGAFDGVDPALARCLAAANYHVILTGPNVDALLALAGEIAGTGSGTTVLVTDLPDPTALSSPTADAAKVFGHIDPLVSKAGQEVTIPVALGSAEPLSAADSDLDGHRKGQEMSESKGSKRRSRGFAVAADSWMDRYTRAHGVESSLLMLGRRPNESRPLEWWERMAFSERR
jgi:NAD(P)-dependent dehydrogenase (short-subunit alcohol dehydrogenase family)